MKNFLNDHRTQLVATFFTVGLALHSAYHLIAHDVICFGHPFKNVAPYIITVQTALVYFTYRYVYERTWYRALKNGAGSGK